MQELSVWSASSLSTRQAGERGNVEFEEIFPRQGAIIDRRISCNVQVGIGEGRTVDQEDRRAMNQNIKRRL